ncbi:hypothetical protein BT96DRAFT_942317 [Gymnopus androsaceus JB14]|uniref:Uncharacterized protein n=1 Tax=Gymnopus androsaceus JB14 TaxID=1447944 RepID=A0A6A4HEB7_9AGAR|nr:hypothetical protein BT96DRAFT_942317 [Gymnopus androsaceus JB14]
MSSPAKTKATKCSPQKPSPYTLHPTYSGTIPSFFNCQSPMQQGLMGIVITFLKEINRYKALEDFTKCLDPTKKSSYKHIVGVCMGRDHPTDFAKLSISRLCNYKGCGSAKEHPVFPMSDDKRQECFQRFCRWLMSTNEITKLRAMKECIPHFEDAAGQLLALDGEITTFLAQSGGTPSSSRCSKRKRDSADPTTPSKQRRVSEGSSKVITPQPFPLAIDDDDDEVNSKQRRVSEGSSKVIAFQPVPLATDDDDDEVEFVEGPSKPIFSKISRRESVTPVAGPSSLGETPALACPTKVVDSNSRWMVYLSHACDELEEAANSDGMQDTILGPKLRALAQTIYNNC